MNATKYTQKLRKVATISWLTFLFVVFGLAWLEILPFNEFLPFLALLLGLIPIGFFIYREKAICEDCGGQMKIVSGFPKIIYRCRKCQKKVHTGIHPDY